MVQGMTDPFLNFTMVPPAAEVPGAGAAGPPGAEGLETAGVEADGTSCGAAYTAKARDAANNGTNIRYHLMIGFSRRSVQTINGKLSTR
jgi:hypothetical protein